VICTLGNFATRLLSGRPARISQVHGHELPIQIADRTVLLYPLFHPAAALYTRSMLGTLEADFARIPALLGGVEAPAPAPAEPEPEPDLEPVVEELPVPVAAGVPEQLGLF